MVATLGSPYYMQSAPVVSPGWYSYSSYPQTPYPYNYYSAYPAATSLASASQASRETEHVDKWYEKPQLPYLVDPITAKEKNLITGPVDRILHLNPLQKLGVDLRTTFVETPKSIYKGLKGDPSYMFSDFMRISRIPYYLGGIFLTYSFLAGRDKVNGVRQGLAVALYYLSMGMADKTINGFYRLKDGIDLDLRYEQGHRKTDKSLGKVEKVFASVNFPRIDLITPEEYRLMRRRMEIPENIADPNGEIQDRIKDIISASRASKLVLGTLMAVLGAGYIARTDAWVKMLAAPKMLASVWKESSASGFGDKIAKSFVVLGSLSKDALQEKLVGLPGSTPSQVNTIRGLVTVTLGLGALLMFMIGRDPKRSYQQAIPQGSASAYGRQNPWGAQS